MITTPDPTPQRLHPGHAWLEERERLGLHSTLAVVGNGAVYRGGPRDPRRPPRVWWWAVAVPETAFGWAGSPKEAWAQVDARIRTG